MVLVQIKGILGLDFMIGSILFCILHQEAISNSISKILDKKKLEENIN